MTCEEDHVFLNALLQHLSIGVALKDADRDFRVIRCNEAFASMMGCPMEAIIGKRENELGVSIFDASVCDQQDHLVMESGNTLDVVETTHDGKMGRRTFRILKFPLVFPAGNKVLVATYTDVSTFHNLAESERVINAVLSEALVKSELATCVNNIVETLYVQMQCDCVALLDYAPNKRYEIKFECNRNGIQSLHCLGDASLQHLFAMNTSQFFQGHPRIIPDTAESPNYPFWQTLGIRSVIIAPIFIAQLFRGIIMVGFSTYRRPFSNVDRRIMVSMANIIALQVTRIQQNEALRQAQRLESVGLLVSGIAHDFNNMLQGIQGHTEMALDDLPMSGSARESLDAVLQTTEQARGIVRKLLTFARCEPINPEMLDLTLFISDLMKILSGIVKRVATLTFIPAEAHCYVSMDPAQVTQLLTNLIVNARDAIEVTEKKGTITVKLEIVKRSDALGLKKGATGEYVQLTVDDTGCGMEESIKQHIFDPFFTTKAAGKGTGLGLSTVHGIIMQNQGTLAVQSDLGKGSSFIVQLPRHIVGTRV